MATNFPTALDAFPFHAHRSPISYGNWNNVQDAIEALQGKVGINSATDEDSFDYRVSNLLIPSAPTIDPDDYQDKLAHIDLSIRKTGTSTVSVYVPIYSMGSNTVYGPFAASTSRTQFAFSENTFTIKDAFISGTAQSVLMAYIHTVAGEDASYFTGVDIKGTVNASNDIVLTFGGDGTALSDTLVDSLVDDSGAIHISVIYSYT